MAFGASSRERSPLPGKENTDSAAPAEQREGTRSRSFSFLGRSKSVERLKPTDAVKTSKDTPPTITPRRSFSGKNKLVKKQVQREVGEVLKQAREDIPAVPPVIPNLASQPQLQTFGGDNAPRGSVSGASVKADSRGRLGSNAGPKSSMDFGASPRGVPMPPIPANSQTGEAVDPYARTESMTNRSRYSYASSFTPVNGPRRVRRRKDPTPFNVLVIGASNAGKSSFIDFLRKSCELPATKQRPMTREGSMMDQGPPPQTSTSDAFKHHYLETELSDGERIGLTLWDSEGLEKNIIDLQLRDITTFIEGKFEETFSEENKVIRSPGKILDTHIHCVFLLLDPLQLDLNFSLAKKALQRTGGVNGKSRMKSGAALLESSILDERVDLQVLRSLRGKTTVVPVISKADTVTGTHMRTLKRAIWSVLKENELDPLDALGIELDEDEEDADSLDMSRVSSTDGLLSVSGSRQASVSPAPGKVDSAIDTASSNGSIDGTAGARAKLEAAAESLPPLPLSILTPDPPDIHHNDAEKAPGNIGRAFPWGFADPYDETHCDFVRLKEIVLSEWRADLREKSQQVWYENWRTARLRRGKPTKNGQVQSAGLQVPTSRAGPRQNLNAPRSNPNMAPIRERTPTAHKSPSPLLSHPVQDVSPNTAAASRAQLVHGPPLSPPPAFAPPAPPREFSFAGRDRVGSFSSPAPVRNGSPAARNPSVTAASEIVTALPVVTSGDVGVAK